MDLSGKRPHLIDRKTGEEVPIELFGAVLRASCYAYAEATATQKVHGWISDAAFLADVARRRDAVSHVLIS